jgi:cytochrome b subunit of formate dehydrogenase
MKDKYRRFNTARIIEHLVQITTFCVLVATGLSQKFYSFDISIWFILKLGGIDTVRIVHRSAGLIFSLAAVVHIGAGILGIIVRKWQPSLIITKNDFTSAVHNIKYYLGIENLPAMNGKYTYTQKFEYWGILTGSLMMIGTGAVLWQPVFFARFMTGEVVPLAKVLHSEEALVVFLIIAGWHIYNAVFSPEVFPLNVSIFTGYITKERMIQEHLHELARIEGRTPEEIRVQMQKDATSDREAESAEARRPG